MSDGHHYIHFLLPRVPVEAFLIMRHLTSILNAGANILEMGHNYIAALAERPLLEEDATLVRGVCLTLVMCGRLRAESLDIVNVLIRMRLMLGDDDLKFEVFVEFNNDFFDLFIRDFVSSEDPFEFTAPLSSFPVVGNDSSVEGVVPQDQSILVVEGQRPNSGSSFWSKAGMCRELFSGLPIV
ncbi:hypothetical protein K469DRAFT_683706 [Zopfia rhizophila CBS 207.26]|uniref:Uncharacterized protein n=1 Tax=Zopfia rhizophila CBS 207.26 TaxID=1314779 RepID=A0A6A6EFF3_9PEZI|nr:hypothetical protein K469DRAFT_683706 [Zopfia rhizophila CBS 207.26]